MRATCCPWPALLLTLLCAMLPGCIALGHSEGGGETEFTPPREVNAGDVALPPGYRAEVVATGLTFPTGLAIDAVQEEQAELGERADDPAR